MPWFKIDDAFHGHPKVMELSPAAVGVWTLSGTWCANYLTDGEIKRGVVLRLGGTDEMIQELVNAGLWIERNGAYHFKDWEDYQPMKADVEAEREAARERMRAARAKKKGVETSAEQLKDVQPNNSGTSEEVSVTPAQPIPAQPIPPYGGIAPERETGRTGTRIPKGFTATPEMINWALNNIPNVNWQSSTQKFKSHYASAAGPNQFKTDWCEAWKSWLLGDQERANNKPQQFKSSADQRLERGAQLMEKYTAIENNQLALEGGS